MSDPPLGVHLSNRAARRIALAAQGFARPRPAAPGTRDVQRVVDTVGVVQIDSVNVVVRSQYLPFFSRLGPYDRATPRPGPRRRAAPGRRVLGARGVARAAVDLAAARLPDAPGRARTPGAACARVARDHPELVAAVLAEVARRGPLTSREVEVALAHDLPRQRDEWGWNWSLVKNALEHLFWAGEVSSAGRTTQFERRYAAAQPGAAAGPTGARPRPDRPAERGRGLPPARRDLGAGARGRLGAVPARLLPALARAGPAGDRRAGRRRHPAPGHRSRAGTARSTCTATPAGRAGSRARALLSPFDSLIWQRDRTRAIFGFDYRLEIYVPEGQRVHGYYVLPFLLGEDLVARVDLKSDRAAGVLRVRRCTWEPGRGGAGGPAPSSTPSSACSPPGWDSRPSTGRRWPDVTALARRPPCDPTVSCGGTPRPFG